MNINKEKVLNNWIKDEIVNFERRQDESLKNLELHSKMNDSTAQPVESSHLFVRNNQVLKSQKAVSNKSS